MLWASTSYKRWSKCTIENVGGRFMQELRGQCIYFLYKKRAQLSILSNEQRPSWVLQMW